MAPRAEDVGLMVGEAQELATQVECSMFSAGDQRTAWHRHCRTCKQCYAHQATLEPHDNRRLTILFTGGLCPEGYGYLASGWAMDGQCRG